MPRKGGDFEREICRALSIWWTGDPDADVCFWRTSQSGGRATNRAKTGRKTHQAHCGDISALDESAAVLTRLITIEAKRGYPAASLHALLDRRDDSAAQIYEQWIEQAQNSAKAAGTPYWAIIHKRNGREVTMTVPRDFYDSLDGAGNTAGMDPPILRTCLEVDGKIVHFTSFRFDAFLAAVTPEDVRMLARIVKLKKKSPSPI